MPATYFANAFSLNMLANPSAKPSEPRHRAGFFVSDSPTAQRCTIVAPTKRT